MRVVQFGAVVAGVLAITGFTIAGAANAAPSQAVFAFTDSTTPGSVVLNVSTASGPRAFNASVAGSYDETNGLIAGPYLAGFCSSDDACFGDNLTRRNFFVFDLASLATPALGASLALFNPDASVQPFTGLPVAPGYISSTPSLTYTAFDVSSPLDPATGASAAPNVYADLGTGLVYGSATVSPADNGRFVTVALDAAALAGINARTGASFAVGGAVSAAATAVPEPLSLSLLGFGLTAAVLARRAKPAHA